MLSRPRSLALGTLVLAIVAAGAVEVKSAPTAGLVRPPDFAAREARLPVFSCPDKDELPARWDWREDAGPVHGIGVTPVRDQQSTGACWAFASVAQIESHRLIAAGVDEDLSEQQLLACNTYGYDNCSGGWFYAAYENVMARGIAAENCFPFSPSCVTPPCTAELCSSRASIAAFYRVDDTTDAIKAAVRVGPVAVACRMSDLFHDYRGGVYREPPEATAIDHAILLVGWDDTLDDGAGAWIIKNSWGTDWGDAGYGYIGYEHVESAYQIDYAPDSAAALRVFTPGEGVVLVTGTPCAIEWGTDIAAAGFRLSYHRHSGERLELIATDVPGDARTFVWTAPVHPQMDGVIEIAALDDLGKPLARAASARFAVAPPRYVWPRGGVAITTTPLTWFDRTSTAADGQGGLVIVTADPHPAGLSDLRLSRVDAEGQLAWPEPVTVCATAVAPSVRVACDGAGAVIVTWADRRESDRTCVYAQRVGPDGQPEWADGGIVVSRLTSGDAHEPAIAVSDGAAVIVWRYAPAGGGYFDIYAQRISPAGELLWGSAQAHGLPVCLAARDQMEPEVIAGDDGDLVVAWVDRRVDPSGAMDVYAQRLDASGAAAWATDGVRVNAGHPGSGVIALADLVAGAGGATYVLWRSAFPGQQNGYFIQTLTVAGVASTADLPLTDAGLHVDAHAAPDGLGGCVAGWVEARDAPSRLDVFAQRIGADGLPLWGERGVVVCAGRSAHACPGIGGDGNGGAFVAWRDERGGVREAYAQHLDADGSPLWHDGGEPVALPAGEKLHVSPDRGESVRLVATRYVGGQLHYAAQRLADDRDRPAVATVETPVAATGSAPALSVRPNPFNPQTVIEYAVTSPGPVSLRIYDVAGRLRRTLVDRAAHPRGEGFLARWDGCDDKGSPLACGVYLCRIVDATAAASRKVMLLR